MAAALRALNARIRSNPAADFICSTHFWGPVSNFSLPIAAVYDMRRDPAMYVLGPNHLHLLLTSGCPRRLISRHLRRLPGSMLF